MGGATMSFAKDYVHLPAEVKTQIRGIWGQGKPEFTHAAKQAVCWAIDNVFRHDDDMAVNIAISAGRLAEQLRGQGSDAFIAAFEEKILNCGDGEDITGI